MSRAGYTVSSLATNFIRAEELTHPSAPIRRFRIHGLAPGEAAVVASPANILQSTVLRVAVKPPRKLKVSLNFVFDEAGNGTTRSVASGRRAFAEAKAIVGRQTNLQLENLGIESRLAVPGDLGPLVCGDTWALPLWDGLPLPGCSRGIAGMDEKVASTDPQGWIFFQDDQQNLDGTCLAHEFLHFRGFWDHTSSSNDLMYEYSNGGEMIHRAEALVANPD